eukprot:CAMPEP_0116838176 /NCGR_PEP_ID=MMETSP0418-20121206/9065_1 /TAXON_ID=1158023 /ORGANISM="Astrosyne radiata, Strain 13vi08-1A" /LENGTH=419 /DNA_ID=CAMNT_0004468145 /DNA_START=42 /DNA_END=1301 /DNA_ORIENTATION=+
MATTTTRREDDQNDSTHDTPVVDSGETPLRRSALDRLLVFEEAEIGVHDEDDRRSEPSIQISPSSERPTDQSGSLLSNSGTIPPPETREAFRLRHRQTLKGRRTRINRIRLACGKIVNNDTVEIGMIALIIINAAIMGVATFDFVTENPNMEELFANIDQGFLIIYTIELALQFIYFGFYLLHDGWLVFDLLVIGSSWIFDAEVGSVGNQFQIIRAFRIFRAFRLITRIKVLRDLVAAIGEVIPRMTAIAMLLVLIFYIFAVLFTELFRDVSPFFSTLDASLFTCFEMMTLEWADHARAVMDKKSWAWAPFVAFIAITGFMVFNLIIAVVCDAVSIIDKVAREREARARGESLETPEEQLHHAQQRIDLVTERVDKLLKAQKDMQDMLGLLAVELHRLDASNLPQRPGQSSTQNGNSTT